MPSGSGGQIALFSVGSLYAQANSSMLSTAFWTNFVSEGLEHTIAELEEGAITGYKDAPPSHQGLHMGAGDIQLEPNPNALGAFLRGIFGQNPGKTLVCDAGSWGAGAGGALQAPAGYGTRPVVQHRFTPTQTAFDSYTYLPPHGVMVYKDVGSAFAFEGAVFNSIEFQIQAAQLVKSTVGVMARRVQRISRATSVTALRNPGGRPWVWDMASIQTGPGVSSLAANTWFEALNIRLETPIEGVPLLDGTRFYAEFPVNGFRRVSINGTLSFRDQTEYDNFIAYENRYLRANLTNTSSAMVLGNPASAFYFTLQLDIPQMKILSWSTPIKGPNRLQTSFTGKAELDVNSLYMIEALLTNTTSIYA